MAEETAKRKEAEPAVPEKSSPMAKLMPSLIIAAVVIVFATGGFVVGRLFGARGPAQTASAAQSGTEPSRKDLDPAAQTDEGWFYELDPVVANLNEPGATRYVRITLTLEITQAWAEEEARLVLDQKKPLMKHWLTLYLANQTVDDTLGKTNLLRMQSNIGDIFNQGLFPNAQPRIVNVLFKEFASQ